ncbi:peptidoglycan/LPS O-acetylase OafA/YrhL [Pelomonas saccharophila]|uniref:Peptidoglycan/LPS O-acetylase OafA/YrhL n=1 Tax=Roseateles saccharophilus TaxID=304 RepID=A0ABU1YP61_ROSSA|nr:acyltransferase family protein [Roseateles saccharophilus]MDR7270523.1 peptidoglycan/LPS O-acetylase OafA/YrhL [Roseateles saccharophilus]
MNTSTPSRLPFLDGLRVAAFALLIPYHVGMYYVSWDWHVKSPAASSALEPFMQLSSPWRLGLLFLIAGAACQGLFAKRGALGTLKDRSLRLLLPLIFGMVVIVTPQAYFEVATKAPDVLPGDGGYLDFWRFYLTAGKACRGNDCMVMPTWNHLWFLPYLWLYAALGALVARFASTSRELKLPAWAWLLLPAVPLALMRIFIKPLFPIEHDLVHDLYNHLQYGWLFAIGWASRTPLAQGFWAAALRLRWVALGVSLAGWAVLLVFNSHYDELKDVDGLLAAARTLRGSLTWFAIVAAAGWSQRAFTRESPWLREASKAVFCLYILHQSVIVVLSQWLKPLALPWGVEAVLLIALTAIVSGAAYLVLRRVPGLALLVGIQRTPRKATPSTPRVMGQLTTMPVTSNSTSPEA